MVQIMKTHIYLLGLLFCFLAALTACSPDEHELGSSISKDELIFAVKQNPTDPNTVYIEALNKGLAVAWVTPQGRSLRMHDTLRIAFPGEYQFIYGVMTDAGLLQADPYILKITTTNLNYVQDEMWTKLTGGVGNEKTWVPDNGNYGMKQGFYSCFDPSATYADMITDGGYNWYPKDKVWWEPADGDVGNTEDDLKSFMTFSLKGKAGLAVHRFTDGAETVSEGMFDMNTAAHTISAVDVDFLHGAWADGKAVDFRSGFQILVLNENQMMIANYRDEALSGEGRCIYCWNFVSKNWADSYVPEPDEPEPAEPVLPDGWKEDISESETLITSTTIKWTLSKKTPVNWASQSGKLLNDWTNASDYPDWLGVLDPNLYEGFAMTLNSETMQVAFTTPDGTESKGSYTLDEKGIYTFDGTVPTVTVINWLTFRASPENTLRILQILKDGTGAVTGMWLGIPNPDKPDTEYIAYLFTPKAVFGSDVPEESSFVWGVMKFTTMSWWPTYMPETGGTGAGDVKVTKDGTYTVYCELADVADAGVFCVDLLELNTLVKDPAALRVSDIHVILDDATELAIDQSRIVTGDLEENGNLRIEIFNRYGATAENPPFAATDFAFNSKLAVTFTITGIVWK